MIYSLNGKNMSIIELINKAVEIFERDFGTKVGSIEEMQELIGERNETKEGNIAGEVPIFEPPKEEQNKLGIKQKIANFHNITQNQKNLFFISVIFDSSYNLELYTSIYNSLQRYCRFDFKYLIINVVKDYSSHMKDDIARNLYYREILEPLNDYSKIWTMHQLDKQYFSQMLSFYQKFVKLVLEL